MSDLEIKLDCKTKNLPSFENVENEYIKCNNNQLVIKEAFFKAKKVENVFRYTLSMEKDKFVLIERTKNDFKNSKFNDGIIDETDGIPNIIIVLESPHKNEYNEKFEPITPAQGLTGFYIKNFLVCILKNIKKELKENNYKILIVNPVPYQTSLNFIHKKTLKNEYKNLRDIVWIALWENKKLDLKDKFIKLIDNLKPKLILNCCTKDLKGNVSNAINNNFKTIELSHPCYWTRDERLKKILKPCKNSKNS